MATNQPLLQPTGGYEPQVQDISRQRELSKLLLQQGLEGNLKGQMIGNIYVPSHPLEGLANIYSAYKGRQLAREADTKQAQLADLIRQQTSKDLQDYSEAVTPREAVEAQAEFIPQGQTAVDDQGMPTYGYKPAVEAVPEKKADYNKGLSILMGSKSPQSQALGNALLADMFKTQKLGEGETLVRGNFQGGFTPIAGEGGAKKTTNIKDYEYDVSRGYKGSFNDWLTNQKRAGATNVNVSTEKSYGGAFGQGLAKNDLDLYDQATKSPEALETVKSTKKLLDSGKVYTGFGANAKLDLARVGDALGVVGKDTQEKITNTQQLFANRAQATLDSVKASGLGAGNGFTNADREFLEKAKLGGITYDKTALQKQLDIEERVARASANKWNTRYKSIPKSATDPTGIREVILPAQGQIDTGTGSGRWRMK